MEFRPFPKLARLNREIIISEKIDGTNAQVYIKTRTETWEEDRPFIIAESDALVMFAGSRTKWVTPGKTTDNYGFAQWVKDHAEELFQLGPGQHFGEWWGGKIQRGYGLAEKRFSLFNTSRWRAPIDADEPLKALAPECCSVVPVLYQGPFGEAYIKQALSVLRLYGSQAAPGFEKPEGIVVYHTAANTMFKVTLENDDTPKVLLNMKVSAA